MKKLSRYMNQQEALVPKMQDKIEAQDVRTKAHIKAINEKARGLKDKVKST
jgi:hypothetical protein